MDWEPFRADHSIDQASILLLFADLLTTDQFDAVTIAARRATSEAGLSDRLESVEPIEISRSTQAPIRLDATSMPRRINFRRLDTSDRVVDEFSISNKSVIFTTRIYRSWGEYLAEFHKLLDRVREALRTAGVESSFKVVQLKYIDRFTSNKLDVDPFEVIRKDSPHITHKVKGVNDRFHTRSGWFERSDGGASHLTNVEIDLVEQKSIESGETKKRIDIVTLRQTPPDGSIIVTDPIEVLESLHTALKRVFKEIISDEVAQRVALDQ